MLMNYRFLEQISCLAQEDLLIQTKDCFAFRRPVVNQGCVAERSLLLLGKAFPTASFSLADLKIQDWGDLQKLLNTRD